MTDAARIAQLEAAVVELTHRLTESEHENRDLQRKLAAHREQLSKTLAGQTLGEVRIDG